jgi:hypothetical protein
MPRQTADEFHLARKKHICDWCGELILRGAGYRRYRWFDYGDAGTCRMHPECHSAMCDAAHEEGGWIEFSPGENERPILA